MAMSQAQNIEMLSARASALGPREAADLLLPQSDAVIAQVMQTMNPSVTELILEELTEARRMAVLSAAPSDVASRWRLNMTYPAGSVGRLMNSPKALFSPRTTVHDAIETLRELVKQAFITYAYVIDDQGRLLGVIVMRELMLARHEQTLEEIMLRKPFWLTPEMTQIDAMRAVLKLHYPVYPVCEADGKLVGLLRGSDLFEQQAVELSAQAGAMVGVEKEERLATPWTRSLKFRQPWLQLNLLTAFVAAAVVGVFQGTIDKIVVLAAFLPVLAGQSGNTGCQALAVALRAMTLGEFKSGAGKVVVLKEAVLGLCNGFLVGISAGIGMFIYASSQHNESALKLAIVVAVAMTCSCVISGISGVMVPLTLKRFGFDPATASSIFLTTATDVASMGMLLGLATLFVA
jgi:magnesium transporter